MGRHTKICESCRTLLYLNAFSGQSNVCRECISKQSEYCEPCAKLDASQVPAVEQIDETWVCKRCAHAVRFMKERERIEIEIFIRSGKCPF